MVMYIFIKSFIFVPATYVEVEKYIFSAQYWDAGSVHCNINGQCVITLNGVQSGAGAWGLAQEYRIVALFMSRLY